MDGDLTTREMVTLTLPSLPLGLLQGPAAGILASIYVSHFGLGLGVVGLVTVVARLFDAVTDPLIGYVSDRTRSRWGKRKPFVVAGMVIVCVAISFVYMPPAHPSAAYFLSWFLLLYLGWTLLEIPMGAWAAEATGSARARMRVFMFRWIMVSCGWILMFAIPFLPVFASREITPETLRWIGSLGLVTMPVFTVLAVAFVRRGKDLSIHEQMELLPFLRSAIHNGPFLIYLTTALLFGLSTGVYFAVNFLYFTQVLGYVEGFTVIGLVTAIVAVPAYWLWTLVSDRVGHYRMCAVATFGIGLTLLVLLFIPPGAEHFPFTLALLCGTQACASGWYVAAGPLLADAADFDLLKAGVNRVGKYFAFQAFIAKVTNGAGGGLAFMLLGLFGYDAAVGVVNSGSAIAGFKLTMIALPILLSWLGALIVLRFPITHRRHDAIRRRLEARAARVAAEGGIGA